jgi:hypothetical protein
MTALSIGNLKARDREYYGVAAEGGDGLETWKLERRGEAAGTGGVTLSRKSE